MLVYKYHDDEDENEDEYICSHAPLVNNEVYLEDYNNPYYTSNYIFDSEYNMNLIHLGETFYLDYKNHLAYEKIISLIQFPKTVSFLKLVLELQIVTILQIMQSYM